MGTLTETLWRKLRSGIKDSLTPDKALLSLIVKDARQAFPGLKAAAFSVLRLLVGQAWAQPLVAHHVDLESYLFEPQSESETEWRQAKHDIIVAMHQVCERDSNMRLLYGSAKLAKLREFRNGGPYYAGPSTAIATVSS